jgi:hypothetical protein
MIWTAKSSHYNCNPERLCNASALIILTAFAMRHLLFLFENIIACRTKVQWSVLKHKIINSAPWCR